MARSSHRLLAAASLAALPMMVLLAACGGPKPSAMSKNKPAAISSEKFKNATRCDATKPGRELSYHDVSGHGKADMVEVIAYSKGASGLATEGRVICMEVDTNRDGVLDLLRTFAESGDLEAEEADRNYDGKSDLWINYDKGLIAKQAFDSKFAGKADEFHYYKAGKLKRVERDRNADGNIDVWEYYDANARLERMGVDLDFNGRIDIWYRDEVARAEQKKISGATAAAAASASASASASAKPKAKEAM